MDVVKCVVTRDNKLARLNWRCQ